MQNRIEVWRTERHSYRADEISGSWKQPGRSQCGSAGQTINERGYHSHAVGINDISGQRWHFDYRFQRIGALIKHGAPDILRSHHVGVVVAEISEHGAIDDSLIVERGVVAGIEARASTARPM